MNIETFDSRSLGSRFGAYLVRKLIAPGFNHGHYPETPRRVLERLAKFSRVPRGLEVREQEIAGLPAEWLIPTDSGGEDQTAILYLHGGGFVAGSRNTHRELAARIAKASGARVLLPEYRLAPEHPYPAANDDCLSVYRWLLEHGTAPGRLVIGGDSAGGFLTISTLLALRDAGDPLPAGGFGLSPATDLLHYDGQSVTERVSQDPWFGPDDLQRHSRRFFAGATPPTGEMCLFEREFDGLPPLLVQVGGREMLYSDAERVIERAAAAGVPAQLQVWSHLWHGFHSFAVFVREGREAIAEIGRFVSQCTKSTSESEGTAAAE